MLAPVVYALLVVDFQTESFDERRWRPRRPRCQLWCSPAMPSFRPSVRGQVSGARALVAPWWRLGPANASMHVPATTPGLLSHRRAGTRLEHARRHVPPTSTPAGMCLQQAQLLASARDTCLKHARAQAHATKSRSRCAGWQAAGQGTDLLVEHRVEEGHQPLLELAVVFVWHQHISAPIQALHRPHHLVTRSSPATKGGFA